ncbi:MAG: hypothetical protein Q7T16_06375 [Candidatus Burarchaeum sp.]|nr:hypothetical protein [Candidatus Burarchaeum sp.]MDO8340254.1 hypothetical protein [Candidatus Burarchaeum sp.]
MAFIRQKPPPLKSQISSGSSDLVGTNKSPSILQSSIFTSTPSFEHCALKDGLESIPEIKEILALSVKLNSARTDLEMSFKTPLEAWNLNSTPSYKLLHDSTRQNLDSWDYELSAKLRAYKISPEILEDLIRYFSEPGYENLPALNCILVACNQSNLEEFELKTMHAIDAIFRRKLASLENTQRDAATERTGAIIYNGGNPLQVSEVIDFIFLTHRLSALSTSVCSDSEKIIWASLALVDGRPVYDSAKSANKPQFFLNVLAPDVGTAGQQPANAAKPDRQTN